ncbi:hypothetical protein RvY_09684 [Ramazzottius varieornatus]|uniref:Uncharacterized protein n=1 Tax=Ramazzottius varieornatus TaxID=947166 RepID=A0A1D1VA93_RAMVA|nr:hypothetical protein RvY_09684 [Ramazzottius varieornatus]
MPPQPAFPEDLAPDTLLFTAFKTGHHFASYDTLFDHLVGCKFPTPTGKLKEKGAGQPIIWHDRDLSKSTLTSGSQFDFHVQLAILYLVPLTPSRSLDQLVATLNEYLRRRFVKGEKILFKRQNEWEHGAICSVRYSGPVLDELSLDGTRYLPRDFLYDVKTLDDGTLITDMTCKQLRRPAFDRPSIRSCILLHCKCREPRKTSSLWTLKVLSPLLCHHVSFSTFCPSF